MKVKWRVPFIGYSGRAGLFLASLALGGVCFELPSAAAGGGGATNTPAGGNGEPVRLPAVTVFGTNVSEGLKLDQPAPVASRLDLPARELPLSVTVVDRAMIEEYGARSLLEAAQLAPGMTAAEPVSTPGIFSSRGFTGNDVVALYDGVPFGPLTMAAHPEDTWKYSSIEVLKGPSSLLYGEGALAGVVNYVPKKPNPDGFENEVFTSYGSFNTSRLGLGSGGPLGKTGLSYRLDFSRQSSDGYVEDTGYEYYDVSGALRFDVSERLTLTLSFDVLREEFGGYWGTPLVNGEVDDRTREVNYNIENSINTQDTEWFRLQADWRGSDAVQAHNLLYGYLADRHWRNVERYTYSATTDSVRRSSPVEILHDQDRVGDRLDLEITHDLFGQENRLMLGAEGSLDDFQRDSNRPDSGYDYVDLYNPASGLFEDVRSVATTDERRTRTLDGALLLEDRLKLFDRFSLIGGVRGEVIDLESTNLRASGDTNRFHKTYTPVTGRVGGVLEPVTNLNLYALYSTAAKAPSVLEVLDESYRDFGLEYGEMVEVGIKQSLWRNRVDWTLALYQIWKEDIVTRDPVNSSVNLQIGKQSSRGIEFALNLRPAKGWDIGGNLAVLEAQYDEFNVASSGKVVSYAGNTPVNVPDVVANCWTSYRFPWNLRVGALARYVSQAQANYANTIELPEYTTLDLFATYAYKDAEFTLRVRNVLDEEYSAWSVGDGAQVLLGAPLSVEGSVTYRF